MIHSLIYLITALTASDATTVNQNSHLHHLPSTSFGIFGRNATYDYIIIGAGIAGSVAAARLTEANLSVALIEAGSFYELTNGNHSQIPFYADDAPSGQADWGVVTEPQVSGNRYRYAQGKALGGSSKVNSMLYHWPSRGAMGRWAEVVGDGSWRWEAMSGHLGRSARFKENSNRKTGIKSEHKDEAGDGSLDVSKPAYINPLSAYGSEAFASIGLGKRASLTNGSLDGYGSWQLTMNPDTGMRSDAETAFLTPALYREGLTVYPNAHARRILFDEKTATGVLVTTNDDKSPFILSARKEVLVAAGVYHSPQLLMVSGVGPKAILKSFDIPVVKHLPGVGQIMHDSCYIAGPVYEITTPGLSYWREPGRMAKAAEQFLQNASGPLTNIGLDLAVFDLLPESEPASLSKSTRGALGDLPPDWPVIEYSLSSTNRIAPSQDPDKHYGTIDCVLTATTSRGNMTITSPSNLDPPIINPNWLATKSDQDLAIRAYHRARKAWDAVPDHIKSGKEIFPGPNVTTDEEILQAIMESGLGAIHHATASCKMGREGDPDAVIDSKGRVFGVRGLRVIDSSVHPFTTPGHIQGMVYAVAEKLVEDVVGNALREGGVVREEDGGLEVHGDLR